MIARVGHAAITAEEILGQLRSQGQAMVQKYEKKKSFRSFVEDQVRFQLLVQAALERGLYRDPAVVEAAHKVMVRRLLQGDLGDLEFRRRISEKSIRRYYDRHMDEYVQPEKRRIADIQLAATEQARVLAISILEGLIGLRDPTHEFRLLAARHSRNKESKFKGGESLYFSQQELAEQYGPEFAARVFSEEPGPILSEPIQSRRGWHILRVISVRAPLLRPLEEVKNEIVERLAGGRRSSMFESYLKELEQRHPIAIYDDRLEEARRALSNPGDKHRHEEAAP